MTDKAAIEAQRDQPGRFMCGLARADIGETRQQGRAEHVAIAQYRSPERQCSGNLVELNPIEQLPVREMHIGDDKVAKIENLTDPPDNDAALQGQDTRRIAPGQRAPCSQPMMPAGQHHAGIISPHRDRQYVDLCRGLLHQQQIRALVGDQ